MIIISIIEADMLILSYYVNQHFYQEILGFKFKS